MRQNQLIEALKASILQTLSILKCATIAKVTGVNETTINCQPVINSMQNGESKPMPEFVEVPVFNMQGGFSYTAYPIQKGDYCLLVVLDQCVDGWWNGQDNVASLEGRMHDYSDAIALVGLQPMRKGLTIPNVITTVGESAHEGKHTHEGQFDQFGEVFIEGNTNIQGSLDIFGTITQNKVSTYSGTFTTADGRTVTVLNGLIMTVV
jgi:hypothetical protein